ncbi:replicative DNA helicase [Helicobacter sp. 12S02634-8]|uniref:replicative DNA helicase n=1 Tax=Helicobacter sp. 12S02634-8 TaxID=1476199 RepID=UPI000BA6AF15|nr:replicative DNA helicase [Helicobacter sp. 12S02634-8]PAF47270.1 replicative DNA helicase [Helicobacter sp. 12S02634-8]
MLEIPNSHPINIERIVISSIMFDPNRFDSIADLLEPKDFSHIPHRTIFEIALDLFRKNLPLDAEFIRSKIPENKKISDDEFLYILSSNPIANIEGYIKELKSISLKRELHSLANTLREKSMDAWASSEEILDEIEKQIYSISMKTTESGFRDSPQIIDSTIALIQERKQRGNHYLTGLNTGFKELNKKTTGFNKGELIIIGARPSMGKTALFLNMAQTILNHDKGVAVFSLEMPAEHLMLRLLSAMTSIPLGELKTGNLNDNQWQELSRYSEMMASKDLFIDDGSSLSINQLRSKLRKLKSKNQNIEIAIIDYLQLMGNGNRRPDMMRQEEISEISRGLKTLARELEIPIIALSQLNRSVDSRDDKRPILSDLRESGAIEQDADIILFLYRDEVYRKKDEDHRLAKLKKEGDEKKLREYEAELRRSKEESSKKGAIEPAEIIVAKNRNGEIGTIKIQFNGTYTRFEDIASETEVSYTATSIPTATSISNSAVISVADI